jgi:hypothetical protein
VAFRRVSNWIIGFIDNLFTQVGTTGNTALQLIYTLSSSPLHTHTHTHSRVLSLH